MKQLAVVAILLITQQSLAKGLANRLGASVGQSLFLSTPVIGSIYFPNEDYAVVTGIGVDTQKNNSSFELNAGVRRVVFKEANMNFFFGGRLGLLTKETSGNKESGYGLAATFGGEFFFQGLENLGFSFEGGIGVESIGDVRFKTVGLAPINGLVTFYF